MIFDLNEENLDLLAVSACPIDLQGRSSNFDCMLLNNEVYYGVYDGSAVATCRACWLKWLSESEDSHEK